MMTANAKPPVPPFSAETARKKVKAAQDAWNTKDPLTVKNAYTDDCIWRNRDQFFSGHDAIVKFLTSKWEKENGYRLRKELFAFSDDRIAVQFWYEYYTTAIGSEGRERRQWFRCYGLEDWTFAADGRMRKRQMSGNDVEITDDERWFVGDISVDDPSITAHLTEKHW